MENGEGGGRVNVHENGKIAFVLFVAFWCDRDVKVESGKRKAGIKNAFFQLSASQSRR